jgi:predicted ATP-grasp superfamily ATP-dependent carboligase
VSVYRESIPLDKDLVQKSFALLKALGWNGVAMVEFKIDARDGLPKLMEVNARFWGSLQLAVDAGVNFPLLLYRLACGEDAPPQFDYKVGVKSRWLLGDLDQLFIRLTRSGGLNGLSERFGSRLGACIEFLKFYERDLHYEVFRLDDSRPGWFELKEYMRDALQKFAPGKERAHAD